MYDARGYDYDYSDGDKLYLKCAVSAPVAGGIIGAKGQAVAAAQQQCGGQIKLSDKNSLFPGTGDRVVVLCGSTQELKELFNYVLSKSVEANGGPVSEFKLVMANSAVSRILGKGGETVRAIQQSTGGRCSAKDSPPGVDERLVVLTGDDGPLRSMVAQIAAKINEDQGFRQTAMNLSYGGNWGAAPAAPAGGGRDRFYGAPSGPPTGGYGGGGGGGYQEGSVIYFPMPERHVGALMGKGGARMQEIVRGSGARVSLLRQEEFAAPSQEGGEESRWVKVSGSADCIYRAHGMIATRLVAIAYDEQRGRTQ